MPSSSRPQLIGARSYCSYAKMAAKSWANGCVTLWGHEPSARTRVEGTGWMGRCGVGWVVGSPNVNLSLTKHGRSRNIWRTDSWAPKGWPFCEKKTCHRNSTRSIFDGSRYNKVLKPFSRPSCGAIYGLPFVKHHLMHWILAVLLTLVFEDHLLLLYVPTGLAVKLMW